MQLSKNRIRNFVLPMLDAVCVAVSYILAGILWWLLNKESTHLTVLGELARNAEIIIVAYAIVIIFLSENDRFILRGALAELINVIRVNLLLFAVIVGVEFVLHKPTQIGRGITYITVFMNVGILYASRMLLRAYLLKVHRNRFSTNHVLIVTVEERAEKILRSVAEGTDWDKKISGIAIMDRDLTGEQICGVPVVANSDDMLDYARSQIVDEVFLSLPYRAGDNMHDIVMELKNMGIRVNMSLELMDQFKNSHVELDNMGEIQTVSIASNGPDYRWTAVKRLMDIAGALVGLMITLVVSIFLVPAIKLESKGPVIFKQKRVGKNGRVFYMYKFRSMCSDAEERKAELAGMNEMDGLMFKMEDDPRVTKVGKFIRKTSLDELPQFFNVLKGDMSLIGTRPPTLDEFAEYKSYHRRRLSAKPGITGLWQVSGRNDISDFDEVVKLDLEYIDDWSIGLDVRILLKTVGVVFAQNGK